MRRHQTAASSGATALILLCVATLAGTLYWQNVQARQREQTLVLQRGRRFGNVDFAACWQLIVMNNRLRWWATSLIGGGIGFAINKTTSGC